MEAFSSWCTVFRSPLASRRRCGVLFRSKEVCKLYKNTSILMISEHMFMETTRGSQGHQKRMMILNYED